MKVGTVVSMYIHTEVTVDMDTGDLDFQPPVIVGNVNFPKGVISDWDPEDRRKLNRSIVMSLIRGITKADEDKVDIQTSGPKN